MGKGMAYDGFPFPGTDWPLLDVGINYTVWTD